MRRLITAFPLVALAAGCMTAPKTADRLSWEGRSVVFLGDSITDGQHIGCETNYWGFLAERMGFTAHVYGVNGNQISHISGQLDKARAELGDDVDAVFIFAGTNDYNGNVPRGDWFVEGEETVDKNGKPTLLKKREPSFDKTTVRGRLNRVLADVKRAYPRAQVVLMTPLHRGKANFGANNVQPDERYANTQGYFIEDIAADVKHAGEIWSVPVIDLYGESGLLPRETEYGFYMASSRRPDLLHPSTAGHERRRTIRHASGTSDWRRMIPIRKSTVDLRTGNWRRAGAAAM